MSKLRSVSTSFWCDSFIEELTPDQKLLFLYLLSNDRTNMLGVYEITESKISFETGITKVKVKEILVYFEKHKRIKYIENFVIIFSFLKHQKLNTNMKKSARDTYFKLPQVVQSEFNIASKDESSKAFESLVKIEIELEEEYENEIKNIIELENEIKEGKDDILTNNKKKDLSNSFIPPKLEDINEYLIKKNIKRTLSSFEKKRRTLQLNLLANNFLNQFESEGWKIGNTYIKDWKTLLDKWVITEKEKIGQIENIGIIL